MYVVCRGGGVSWAVVEKEEGDYALVPGSYIYLELAEVSQVKLISFVMCPFFGQAVKVHKKTKTNLAHKPYVSHVRALALTRFSTSSHELLDLDWGGGSRLLPGKTLDVVSIQSILCCLRVVFNAFQAKMLLTHIPHSMTRSIEAPKPKRCA